MRASLFRDLPTEGWPSMERYADQLVAALRELGCDVESYVSPRPGPRLNGRPNALANYAWRTLAYPAAARGHQGDVNHILDHTYAHLIGALEPRRTVITCHDLAPLSWPESGGGLARGLWERSFKVMTRAAHLITVSEFVRQELAERTGYPVERITVVPQAASAVFGQPVASEDRQRLRERFSLGGRPLILHVGSCAPRKNIEAILDALPLLADLEPYFVQVGGRFSESQQLRLRDLHLQETVKQIAGVPDAELAAWYRAADIFVFPSFYEGFGLPVLEAMAAGAPVICARAASLPEVAGDAALLIDPHDPQTLADAIRLALSDEEVRAAHIERGLARSREFRWLRTAGLTLEVYEHVAATARSAR